MSKKSNNKYLLIVLLVLIGLYFISDFLYKRNREKSDYKVELITFDTSDIASFTIIPQKDKNQPIEFSLLNGQWMLEQDGLKAKANQNTVEAIINELMGLQIKRLISRSKDQWKEYAVSDSLASEVVLRNESGEELLALHIGRFNYQQSPQGGNPYGGNQGIIGTSYIRPSAAEETYAVDGFLSMSFNRDFNSWRDGSFLKLDKPSITAFNFTYPADSGFQLRLAEQGWVMDGQTPVDSALMQTFMNKISNKSLRDFEDNFQPGRPADYALEITGISMNPIQVQAWRQAEKEEVVMLSSQNADVYFNSQVNGVFKDLFRGSSSFLQE